MGHDHDHHGHHHHAPETFNKAFAIAVILNLVYTVIEAAFAMHANSTSLLADAGHNLADVLGLALAWGASWLLTRPKSERYSYGYKRTSILTAIFNAVVLIITCIIIFDEAIGKLLHPHSMNEIMVVIVAVIGIFINAGTAIMFVKGAHDDLNIKGAFLHLAMDALVSFGVVIGALVIYYTHWSWLDPVIGLLIGIFILYGTWELLISSINLIMDGVPKHINVNDVIATLKAVDGVTAVHDLHIWGLSTRDIALTAHLVIPGRSFEDSEYQTISETLKDKFKIGHVTLQIEKGNVEHCHNDC